MVTRALERIAQGAAGWGVPPALLGWRWPPRVPIATYIARHPETTARLALRAPRTVFAPLPRNLARRDALPDKAGPWGHAMRDVPERTVAPAWLARIEDARLLFHQDPATGGIAPALISAQGISIEASGIAHRPGHGAQAAASARGAIVPQHVAHAVWVLERDWHDHARWLLAHLPKLLLLKGRGLTGEVLMPRRLTPLMAQSMAMLGIDPARLRRFDPARPVEVDVLTIPVTDPCDPALMRGLRGAFANPARHTAAVSGRVFASPARSRGRRIVNEAELWAMLGRRGFARVVMEELAFTDQVALMQDTRVLIAPHGAGLAAMLFCPEGGHVIELADPGYPSPAGYDLAAGLGHHYWLLFAAPVAARDLTVDVDAIAAVLDLIG